MAHGVAHFDGAVEALLHTQDSSSSPSSQAEAPAPPRPPVRPTSTPSSAVSLGL